MSTDLSEKVGVSRRKGLRRMPARYDGRHGARQVPARNLRG